MKQNSCIALINEIVHDMSDCFFSKDISEMSENRIIHEIQKVNDVNCTDKHGGTLLHYAAAYRMNKVLAYLISHGADINCQDKRGKGYGCGEWFALLAGETIERSGLALGKQVGDVGISEQLSCYLLEHWHTALLVAASYYLSEELHGTMLAFRTLAAGILVAEKSVTT